MLKTSILLLVLVCISFGIYANSLRGEYLIDDQKGILENSQIHDLKVFLTQHFRLAPGKLSDLAHAILWQVGGGRPFVFHLFNVFIHALVVALFFILLQILFKNTNLSFLAALIFAVHPIHTEAVSWISGGPYAFASAFFLLAMVFYVRHPVRLANMALAVFFFALCLLASNIAAALPFMFLAYEIFFREKEKGAKDYLRLRLWALGLLIGVALLLAYMFFSGRNQFVHTIFYFRGPSYLIVIAKALVYYLRIIYLPLRRGLYHPFAYNTTDTNKFSPAFFLALLIIGLAIYFFIRYRKKNKPISFGIAFFFITYLPYSNLIPVCNIISERYVYLASAGICLILAVLFLKVWEIISLSLNLNLKKFLRIIAMTALVLFILSYAVLTVKHNRDYRDIITYWEANINNFPDGYMAYNNLAGTFYTMGQREQAIAYSWVNLMINAKQPHVWCNLGKVYREKGDYKMAKYCYEEALKVDKGFLSACHALEELKKLKNHSQPQPKPKP